MAPVTPSRSRVLAIFVKAPIVGRVKTRLAAGIGAQSAVDLYRVLGRTVVSACIGSSYDTVVWFTPAKARPLVVDWLGGLEIATYRAQPTGSLGPRLTGAFRDHFREGSHRVIVIGSDSPDIDGAVISHAFASLDEHELVIGPAEDGGYYLIGLRGPAPQLFRGINWSSHAVLEQTLAHAHRLELRTAMLPTLRDIDTPGDARALSLLPPVMNSR
jgi:uncharacterized protein